MIKIINITPNYPSQQLNFQTPTQNITIYLNWHGYLNRPDAEQLYIDTYSKPQFFASIYVGNLPVFFNLPVVNRQPINQYPSRLNGWVVAVGDESPTLENLGITTQLYWIDDLSELDNIQ